MNTSSQDPRAKSVASEPGAGHSFDEPKRFDGDPEKEMTRKVTNVDNCPYCKKPLAAANARFCTECNQWQDLRGWALSQISLGDVALYGSIILLLFTSFQTVVLGKQADMEATALACSNFKATAYLSNTGNAPGILTAARIQAIQGSTAGTATDSRFAKTDSSIDPRTIRPDAGHVFELSLDDTDRSAFFQSVNATDKSCMVSATFSVIIDSKATSNTILAKGSCSCSDFVAS